jgi:uncharacterized protein YcgI (DUF1989 family)
MARSLRRDLIIPAREARALEVAKGQVLRIYVVEGPQVGDCAFFNAHDYKETFHVGQSWALNQFLGTGNARSFKHFFSKPPRENIMLTVLEDTTKNHWGNMGGRCSHRMLALRDGVVSGHRSCQQNLTEALAPYGITGDDIIDVFNVFMNVEQNNDGDFSIKESLAKAGDYIDLLAEMDILAAVSACPADATPTNGYKPKPLALQILE